MKTRIRILTATIMTLLVVARVTEFIVVGAELVVGNDARDERPMRNVSEMTVASGERQTRNVPETTFVSGETVVNVMRSTDGKMTAIVSGKGAMSDETKSICFKNAGYRFSITSAVIEDGVTHIGVNAFFRCDSLASVEIHSSVISIGKKAFYSSGLTSITIPKGVTSIEEDVFFACRNLT